MLVLHQVKKIAVGLEMGRCRYPESDRLMFPVSPSTLCERDRCLEAETLADLGRAPALHQLRLSLSRVAVSRKGWSAVSRSKVAFRRADHEAGDRSRSVEMRRGSGPLPAAAIPLPGGPVLGSLELRCQAQCSEWTTTTTLFDQNADRSSETAGVPVCFGVRILFLAGT